MIGFSPGFPYLAGLPLQLHTPRRSSPRMQVPAGSVAIGGEQTGIYSRDTPGGWNIIGRTPVPLFDPERDPPCLLRPGDAIRFIPIDRQRFDDALERA
jgi:inhibitor of KinA